MRHTILLLAVGFTTLMVGCGAVNGNGLDEFGRPLTQVTPPPDDEDDGVIKPTISSIQQHIFTPICSSCHGGVNPAAGQDLSSVSRSLDNLINVGSANPLFNRVVSGDPEVSYLYLKVSGSSQAGARMPLGQPALDDEMISAIKQWITQGALAPQDNSAPVRVSSAHTHIVKPNHYRVMLGFNKAMNFSDLTPEQLIFDLANSATLAASDMPSLDVQSLSLTRVNAHLLQIDFSLEQDVGPIAALRAHIRFNLNNVSTLTSLSGQPLDGDYDGIDGGEFNVELSF